MNTVIQAENITKLYSNGRGIENISFSLQPGDAFGLLGANGAGKTTVMKVLTGLINPSGGKASLFGFDITDNRKSALASVGAIIEAPVFYGYLSILKNLKLAASYYPGIDKNNIEDILRKVSLWDFRKEKAERLSLGMKQRLGLALAMIGNPMLYILDEPTNGLDIEGRVDIRNVIIDLSKNKDTTFLISSHLPEEIEKTCNKVGVIKNGRMIEVQDMKYIFENYPSLEDYYLNKIGSEVKAKIDKGEETGKEAV